MRRLAAVKIASSAAMELDRADLTLLEMLQRDGRTTVQALSEAIHLSARATLNRVRKLEAAGPDRRLPRPDQPRARWASRSRVFAEIALKDQRQAVGAALRKAHGRGAGGRGLLRDQRPLRLPRAHRLPAPGPLPPLISAWLDDASLGVEKIVTNIELQTIKEFAGFPLPRHRRRSVGADRACSRIKARPTPLPIRKCDAGNSCRCRRAPAARFTPVAARSGLDFPHHQRTRIMDATTTTATQRFHWERKRASAPATTSRCRWWWTARATAWCGTSKAANTST